MCMCHGCGTVITVRPPAWETIVLELTNSNTPSDPRSTGRVCRLDYCVLCKPIFRRHAEAMGLLVEPTPPVSRPTR